MILWEFFINCDCLVVAFLFLIDFFFTRRLPRSTTLRLLKQKRILSIWRSILYRLTSLQCLIACICFRSDALQVVVIHIEVYVHSPRTPSSRCSPSNASNKIELELNLIQVAMFVMPDHLFIHSFHWNFVICTLIYTICVGPLHLSELGNIMMPESGASFMSCSYTLKGWSVHCCLYDAIFMSYYVSIYAMKSLWLSVEELTILMPV